ncbi:MAG: LD-carboxypeptidase, partial [Bacteroidales bacterium]|nr:LD-carboxypeptidase [Bacteroidales bacterium]
HLKSDDKIAIIAPAGKIDKDVVDFAKNKLESWGLNVILGEHVFNQHFQYAGTDEERLSDFQKALDDESVKAIFCARGGYGLIRIVDQLDFSSLQKNPKWIIGFSDITILHSHVHSNFGIETLHATMAAGLKDDISAERLRKSFFKESLSYELETHPLSKPGDTKGILVGGNLAILCSLIGSVSDIDTEGKILFIEDVGEYLFRLDRMMWALKRAGKLDKPAGLIVGGFGEMKDNDSPFGKSAYEIISEAVEAYDYPVCFGFPAGHQEDNRVLILGRQADLSIGDKTTLNIKHRTLNSEPRTSN